MMCVHDVMSLMHVSKRIASANRSRNESTNRTVGCACVVESVNEEG
jgi:hypothetical protein